MTCADCRYQDFRHGLRTCRRHSPRPGLQQHDEALPRAEVAWPIVEMDDWCGEHEPVSVES
jgi:hypothetical protein